jgi:hypothetical protein
MLTYVIFVRAIRHNFSFQSKRPPTEPTDPAVLDLAPFLASMEGLRPRTKPTPFHKRTMQFERERNRLKYVSFPLYGKLY